MGCIHGRNGGGLMRATYRQPSSGPIRNLAHNPRGTVYQVVGQFIKWQSDRWGGDGTYSLLTGISGHPDGITTAARLTTTTTVRASHGFHLAGNPEAGSPASDLLNMLPARPGERLTVSLWLRYTGTSTQGYGIRFRPTDATGSAWIDNGLGQSSVSLPTGAWIKLSLTYTVPAGTSFVAIYVTNNVTGVVDAIGDTIDGTGLMVTRTPAPRANIAFDPYATTITIPNGRFGWIPRWFGGTGNAGTTTQITDATDGPNGITTYLRKTWTAVVVSSVNDVGYTHTANGIRTTQGDVLAIDSYFRASKDWTVKQHCRLAIAWYDGVGVQIGANVLGSNIPTVTAGTWHKLSLTATAPVNTVTMFAYQLVYVENGAWAVGDTIDGTGLMVTRNPPLWKFADGNSPGWKWLGAVNTSESAGYPQPY